MKQQKTQTIKRVIKHNTSKYNTC